MHCRQAAGSPPTSCLTHHRRSPPHPPTHPCSGAPGSEGAIAAYLTALGNTPVLGRAQEARLAAIMQKGRQVEAVAARLAAAKAKAGGAGGGAAAAAAGALRPNSAEARREAAAAAAAAAARVSDAEVAAACGLPAGEVAARRVNQREAKDLLMQYNVRRVRVLVYRRPAATYSCLPLMCACAAGSWAGCSDAIGRPPASHPTIPPTHPPTPPPTHQAGWWSTWPSATPAAACRWRTWCRVRPAAPLPLMPPACSLRRRLAAACSLPGLPACRRCLSLAWPCAPRRTALAEPAPNPHLLRHLPQRAWWGSARRSTALTPAAASRSPPSATGGSASRCRAPSRVRGLPRCGAAPLAGAARGLRACTEVQGRTGHAVGHAGLWRAGARRGVRLALVLAALAARSAGLTITHPCLPPCPPGAQTSRAWCACRATCARRCTASARRRRRWRARCACWVPSRAAC